MWASATRLLTRRKFGIALGAAAALRGAEGDQSVQVMSVPNNGIQPQLVVHEDRVHLAYYSGEAAHGDVFYVRSDDFGRRFSPPVRVNSQLGSAIAIGSIRGAQIAVGKNERNGDCI